MKRTPNFLIIGAARSGTTALAKFIAEHPQVFLTTPKEPHFLAFANQAVEFNGPGDQVTINRVAITRQEEYEKLFDRATDEIALGEGSVSSLYYHEAAIQNIKEHAPDAKLIAILRNPIERAFSSFMYMTSRGFEPLADFMAALNEEDVRIELGWHHIWHYTKMGFYTKQLRAFREAFGDDRLKVFLHEDLKESPDELFCELFDFLGVDNDFRPDAKEEINRAGEPKNKALQSFMKLLGKSSMIKSVVRAVVPSGAREKIRSGNLAHPEMSSEARDYLESVFADEFDRLEAELGRDLKAWRSSKLASV